MRLERRQSARERLFERASLVFNGRQSVLGCTLRNLSQTGAMVRLTDWIALPTTFEIEAPGDAGSRRVRQCWRRGDDVGVIFLTSEECEPEQPADLAAFRASRTQLPSQH